MPENHIFDQKSFEANYSILEEAEIKEVCEMFFTEHPNNISKLEAAIKEENFETIRFQSHALKNLLLAFFAMVPAELAEEMNGFCLERNIIKIQHSMQILKPMLQLLSQEITDFLDKK